MFLLFTFSSHWCSNSNKWNLAPPKVCVFPLSVYAVWWSLNRFSPASWLPGVIWNSRRKIASAYSTKPGNVGNKARIHFKLTFLWGEVRFNMIFALSRVRSGVRIRFASYIDLTVFFLENVENHVRWKSSRSVALHCHILQLDSILTLVEACQGNWLIFILIWYSWRESTLRLSEIQEGTGNIGNNNVKLGQHNVSNTHYS